MLSKQIPFGLCALALACVSSAQFKSTPQLVLVPATIKDAQGRVVDGLTTDDLRLYDNGVLQPIQMDWSTYPISVVVAVQTSSNAAAVLDKFNGAGVLFTDLMAGQSGQTAVLSYGDQVKVRQEFTESTDAVSHALVRLRADGNGAVALDALTEALRMFDGSTSGRRRIIVMIGERRDRKSRARLTDIIQNVERRNVAIYWLTYSPFLTMFTDRPHVRDHETPAERRADREHRDIALRNPEPAPGDLLSGLAALTNPDLAELFARTTGGLTMSFLKKDGLEQIVEAVSREVHRQYILSFEPPSAAPGKFHSIRVEVHDRPELEITARTGYWTAQ